MEIVRPSDMWGRFDRLFDDWLMEWPFRRPAAHPWPSDGLIRVDEYQEDGVLVVLAELPGIDPEKDVEVTVADGILHIEAERTEAEELAGKGFVRKELRHGTFARTLPLPGGTAPSEITAGYRDGILEIRIPLVPPAAAGTTKVPVTKG
jgi:HSP20 family protein